MLSHVLSLALCANRLDVLLWAKGYDIFAYNKRLTFTQTFDTFILHPPSPFPFQCFLPTNRCECVYCLCTFQRKTVGFPSLVHLFCVTQCIYVHHIMFGYAGYLACCISTCQPSAAYIVVANSQCRFVCFLSQYISYFVFSFLV